MISKWTYILYREEVDKILAVILPLSSILLSALSAIGVFTYYKQFVSLVMLPASVWAATNTLLNLYSKQEIPEVLRNIIILLIAFPLSLLSGISYIIKYGLVKYTLLFILSIPFFLVYSYLMRFLVAMVIETLMEWIEELAGAIALTLFVILLVIINVFGIIPVLYIIWDKVLTLLGITL